MRRYHLFLSEDKLFTTQEDKRHDITYSINNMTDAWGLVPSHWYHLKNLLRIGFYQRWRRVL